MSGYYGLTESDVMLLVEALNFWLEHGGTKTDAELQQYLNLKGMLLGRLEAGVDQG